MTNNLSTSEFIKDISRDYSIYVCQHRGIPAISDGLKDAQRKTLFVMKSQTDKIKVISLAGELLSKNIYLHGDSSACDTISLMAAPYCNNVPLLHGIGAFGTMVGPTDWGAPRYTYVKKSQLTDALIYQDYDIIPLKENYDGSILEPKHFLPLIPIVLLNGVSGIAVGWSTDILPRALNDLIDATVAAIDNKKKLPEILPKYECLSMIGKPLGNSAYEFTGRVKIDANTVSVNALPPDLSLEKFKERLNQMEDTDMIQTYVDRSTKEINIEIRFKRRFINGSNPWTEEEVIEFLKLRSRATERFVMLTWDGDNIKQYNSSEEIIREFVEWRLGFYAIRYKKLIDDATKTLNFNQAMKLCYDKGLPIFLPKALNKVEIIDKISTICNKISLDIDQIDRIASLASYRWAKDSYNDIVNKIIELQKIITDYQNILADPYEMRAIYRQEVLSLKKIPR